MMYVVVTTGAIRCAKLQIVTANKPPSSISQAGCPSCQTTNSVSVKALKEKCSISGTVFYLIMNIVPIIHHETVLHDRRNERMAKNKIH